MSPLILIKRSVQRKQRLTEAQFLMAKAYRGVPYSSSSGDHPKADIPAKTYRGIRYST